MEMLSELSVAGKLLLEAANLIAAAAL